MSGPRNNHDNLAGQPQRTPRTPAHDQGARRHHPAPVRQRERRRSRRRRRQGEAFQPYNGWRWYITEWDAETGLCFGLVEGFETELGYFDLTELAEVTVFGKVPAVERDLYWAPQTLGEIRRQSRLAA